MFSKYLHSVYILVGTPLVSAQTVTTTRITTISLPPDVQTLWGVCGGDGAPATPWTKTLCEPGAWCNRPNTYLHQCLPISMSFSGIAQVSTTTTTTTTPVQLQTKYGQCGGVGHVGPKSCQPPSTCSTLNPYYWQCL
ncbi:hypothetical protein TWF730_006367 [Orbilia blumenaviensis]|uniref:CBM1 domain-containing protein n=1 Tax=Orbilia blumenaviensis TaxID=1796055 RepID=A0AAV9VHK2_9PEZI